MFLLTEKADPKAVERLVDAEIARLGRTGPKADELERAKNRLRSAFIFGLQSNDARAISLGEFEAIWGDARLLTRELDGYLAVTADDVKRTVAQHLIQAKRNVVLVAPPPPSKPAPAQADKSGAAAKPPAKGAGQ